MIDVYSERLQKKAMRLNRLGIVKDYAMARINRIVSHETGATQRAEGEVRSLLKARLARL